MKISAASIPDVLILEPEVLDDDRGYFFENFNQKAFNDAIGQEINFVQDNHSKSYQGVLRGLHYQNPKPQGKLVRVVVGATFSVGIDLRAKSPTLGQWTGIELSAVNRRQLWIPAGFAHGFVAITESAECLYKLSNYYAPEFEHCIAWNDDTLNIKWPLENGTPILSVKDRSGLRFKDAPLFI